MITYKQAWSLQNNRLTDAAQFFGKRGAVLAALSFFITYRCNYRCFMCLAEDQIKNMNRDGDIGLFMERLSSARFGPLKPFIKISGGEPLLHPDFRRFIVFLKENGFKCSINTNGYFLPRYDLDFINHKLDILNVTILGPEGIYREVSGGMGSFKEIYGHIERLISLKKKYHSRHPKIIVNIPLNHIAAPYINDIIDRFKDLDIQGITIQHLVFSRQHPRQADKIDLHTLVREAEKAMLRKERFPVKFFPEIPVDGIVKYYTDLDHLFRRNSCIMPWLMMSVAPDGAVNPCFFTEKKTGVLKRSGENFHDIWNNEEFGLFRDAIKKGALPDRCKRCCIRKY